MVQRRFDLIDVTPVLIQRLINDALSHDEVREFLADASSYFGQRAVNIWIEDRKPDATLGPALIALELHRTTEYSPGTADVPAIPLMQKWRSSCEIEYQAVCRYRSSPG